MEFFLEILTNFLGTCFFFKYNYKLIKKSNQFISFLVRNSRNNREIKENILLNLIGRDNYYFGNFQKECDILN